MSNELTPNPAALPAIDRDAVLRALNLDQRKPETMALVMTCEKYNLDPLLKHAVLIQGSLYVTRDGLLHVAHASGRFDGIEVETMPETATHYVAVATVYRKDMGRPFRYPGRYPKSGRMAKDHGPEMAEKVAECRALRRAFDVSLCSREELWDAADDQAPPVQVGHNRPGTARNITPPQQIEQQRPPLSEEERAMLSFGREAAREGFDVMDGTRPSKAKVLTLAREVMPRYPDPAEWSVKQWLAAERELPDHKRAVDDVTAAGAGLEYDPAAAAEEDPETPSDHHSGEIFSPDEVPTTPAPRAQTNAVAGGL
jgi:hypothetical protein